MNLLHYLDKLAGWWLDWRMDQKVKSDPELQEMTLEKAEINQTGYSAAFIGPGVALMADMLSELLVKNNAENYVCFEIAPRVDRGLRPILVTVQWRNGKSPAQARDELLIENNNLKAALNDCANHIESITGCKDRPESDSAELVKLARNLLKEK